MKLVKPWYYITFFLSNSGSLAFTVGLMTFLLQRNHSIAEAAGIVTISRIVPPLSSFLIGQVVDAASPRKLVALTEAGSALFSFFILLLWSKWHENSFIFILAVAARGFFQSLQRLGITKISKNFSQDLSLVEQKRHALALTVSSNSAPLLAGLITWQASLFTGFESLILFDMISSIVCAFFVLYSFKRDKLEPRIKKQILFRSLNPILKFRYFFRFTGSLALLDVLLAACMAGLATLSGKLVPRNPELIPLQMMIFGIAFVFVGFWEPKIGKRIPDFAIWIILAISLCTLSFCVGKFAVLFPVIFLRDVSYAWLFSRITIRMQLSTPVSFTGSVFASRAVLSSSILALGEFISGVATRFLTIQFEVTTRAVIASVGAVAVFFVTQSKIYEKGN
jgi:MFS family permease